MVDEYLLKWYLILLCKMSNPNKLCLGCASFGGVYGDISDDQIKEILEYAYQNGIRYFDTSPFYGNSEEILGKIIKLLNIENTEIQISTKVGRYGENLFDYSTNKIKISINNSLKLLNRDYLDIVYLHDIEFCYDLQIILQESLPYLNRLKKKGIVKQIGISALPLEIIDYILDNTDIKIDNILTYCSYVLNYSNLDKYIDKWKNLGIKVIHGGVTSMGLLTQRGPPEWHPADNQTKLVCQDISKRYPNITEISFNYTYHNPKIDNILVGPINKHQLEEYIVWINKTYDENFRKKITEIRNRFVDLKLNKIWLEPGSEKNIQYVRKLMLPR